MLAQRSESKHQKYLFKNSNIRKMLKSYLPYILKCCLSAVDIARFASRLLLSLATSHSAILYVCVGVIKGTNDVLPTKDCLHYTSC